MTAGEHAIRDCELDEAQARIDDWRILHCEWGGGVTIGELAEESINPRRLSDWPSTYWRERAEEFAAWVEEQEDRNRPRREEQGEPEWLWTKDT